VDVRAPVEFNDGHIPDAINLPLLDDEQRKLVGITYKNYGKQTAIENGLKLVNISKLVSDIRIRFGDFRDTIGIYCFRGGLRSQCMGWLFHHLGYKVHILEGGYKQFRRWIREQFCKKYDLLILSGKTAVGKTKIIELLGSNAINLERLANHKGSVFGGFDGMQPTQQMFENLLGIELSKKKGKFFIEDESRSIGRVKIPDDFFLQMRNAPVIVLEGGLETRVKRCIEEYGKYSKDRLEITIKGLKKHLGGARTKEALLLLEKGDLQNLCKLLFTYYDRKYTFGLFNRNSSVPIKTMQFSDVDNATICQMVPLLQDDERVLHLLKDALLHQ